MTYHLWQFMQNVNFESVSQISRTIVLNLETETALAVVRELNFDSGNKHHELDVVVGMVFHQNSLIAVFMHSMLHGNQQVVNIQKSDDIKLAKA